LTVPHFSQMTAVTFSDVLDFGLGFGGLGLWGCGLVNTTGVCYTRCLRHNCCSLFKAVDFNPTKLGWISVSSTWVISGIVKVIVQNFSYAQEMSHLGRFELSNEEVRNVKNVYCLWFLTQTEDHDDISVISVTGSHFSELGLQNRYVKCVVWRNSAPWISSVLGYCV